MADKKAVGGLPFVGNMGDGVDFVRRMWSATGLPGLPTVGGIAQFAQGLPQSLPAIITPTLDLDEMDRRIADLRAVEQWLALNGNMLRATIQSLEVQRNTIATLKSFGGSVLSTVTRSGGPAPAADAGAELVRQAEARTAARHRAARSVPLSQPAPAAPASRPRRARSKAVKTAASAAHPALPIDPTAWWNMLNEQFARVAAVAAAEAARTDAPTSPQSPAGAARRQGKQPGAAEATPASASARSARPSSSSATGSGSSARPLRPRRPTGADKP